MGDFTFWISHPLSERMTGNILRSTVHYRCKVKSI